MRVHLGLTLALLAFGCGEESDTASARAALDGVRVDVPGQLREQLRGRVERVRRADGITALRVIAGVRHATLVVRRPDGAREQGCFDDAAAALRWLEVGR